MAILPALWHFRRMRNLKRLTVAVALLLFPALVFAQEAASLPVDPASLLGWFAETHKAGHWSLLIGGALTLVLRFAPVLKPLLDKLPAESTKWVAMGVAMLGSIATGLMAGVAWYKVLVDGATVGVAAIGGWELILKPLLAKLSPAKAA